MRRFQLILGVILGVCLMGQSSWASKAYVTDSFKVTLRTGPSIENKVIAMPSSGQPVEVLDSNDDWSYVRLLGHGEGNKEGWMLSRYLVTRLPWEMQAGSLKDENTRLKEKLPRIEEKLSEALRHEQNLAIRLQDKTKALHRLQNDYEALKRGAAEYLKLKAGYTETRSTLETTQKEVQRLTEENERLRSSQRNRWFAIGALVLLCGLIIGLLIGRQQKKPRSSYY